MDRKWYTIVSLTVVGVSFFTVTLSVFMDKSQKEKPPILDPEFSQAIPDVAETKMSPIVRQASEEGGYREVTLEQLLCPDLTWEKPEGTEWDAEWEYVDTVSHTVRVLKGEKSRSAAFSGDYGEKCQNSWGQARENESSAWGTGLLADWIIDYTITADGARASIFGYKRGEEHIIVREDRACNETYEPNRPGYVDLPWCKGYLDLKLTIFIGK